MTINRLSHYFLAIGWVLAALACDGSGASAQALWNTRAQIRPAAGVDPAPFEISITPQESAQNGWNPGQRLIARAYVLRPDGSRAWMRDQRGRRSWKMLLDSRATGRLLVFPHKNSYTGPLNVLVDGRPWTPDGRPSAERVSVEKALTYRFADGAGVRVLYTDETLARYGTPSDFPRQVLDAAVLGYQTITEFQGFRSQGYSFARPDESYAYDPDRTIDIYLGDPAGEAVFSDRGFSSRYFRDAPCFDAVERGAGSYDAVILLPANYADFIRSWEKINPSPLGRRNLEVDLRGTLVHEMLHALLFYYNRNLGKHAHTGASEPAQRDLDWYVEGLARYFETFVGARHDFFSQGFRQTLADKVRFSRGGSNFFMRYPDQAFTGLRYENAIFWRYIDYRFGMGAIEAFSRLARGHEGDFRRGLEEATGARFDVLLDEFALSILMKDFGLKDETPYLNDVARTRLLFAEGQFYLLDGFGSTQALGRVCRTDWVGQWGSARAALGEAGSGGDSTPGSDVSAWATDYYEIRPNEHLPRLRVFQLDEPVELSVQMVAVTRGGSQLHRKVSVSTRRADLFDVSQAVRSQGLQDKDIQTVYLLVTNRDSRRSTRYEIEAS